LCGKIFFLTGIKVFEKVPIGYLYHGKEVCAVNAKQLVYSQETGVNEEAYFESILDELGDAPIPVDRALRAVQRDLEL